MPRARCRQAGAARALGQALTVSRSLACNRLPHARPRTPQGNEAALGPRSENAYIPFGAGARLCIGWRFALQEARMVLVKLYQHFTFELAPGQVPLPVRAGAGSRCSRRPWHRPGLLVARVVYRIPTPPRRSS
jgi:hypothetical protein